MTGYTKLFASILDSTIWREEDKTRLVWITMLAMSNQWGDVEASIPGLADRAHVKVEEAEKAVAILSSPDKYSRTKDHEGRRIEEIDGGWRILNHAKYREKMSQDERREYFRRKQQERRDRLKCQKPVNERQTMSKTVKGRSDSSTLSTQADTDAEAKASIPAPPPKSPPGIVEGKGSDKFPTSEQAKRVAAMFHRKLTTAWPEKEITAYKKLGVIPEEDLALLETYYSSGAEYLRKELYTFLNNFAGELDRARAWAKAGKLHGHTSTTQRRDNGNLNAPGRYT